jgi:hypothetical protein
MISEEKKNLIRKRLIQGARIYDISKETGVSESTIKRYKKEMPYQVLTDRDQEDDVKYTSESFLTKEEKRFTEKIQREMDLYEDEDEGWIYHLTKQDERYKTSGLWWSGIVYPESAPKNWIEMLRNQGFRIAISPLHDKDWWSHDSPEMVDPETGEVIPKGARYKAGSRKKAHWHIIVVSDTRMSFRDANSIIRTCTRGPYVQKCRSLRNAYNYFLHINSPEKYQGYDKDEIQTYNNFHIEPNSYEKGVLQDEILQVIKDKNFTTMDELIENYLGQPEYITILASKPGIFTTYINSRWKKAHPEGRTQLVKLVQE